MVKTNLVNTRNISFLKITTATDSTLAIFDDLQNKNE